MNYQNRIAVRFFIFNNIHKALGIKPVIRKKRFNRRIAFNMIVGDDGEVIPVIVPFIVRKYGTCEAHGIQKIHSVLCIQVIRPIVDHLPRSKRFFMTGAIHRNIQVFAVLIITAVILDIANDTISVFIFYLTIAQIALDLSEPLYGKFAIIGFQVLDGFKAFRHAVEVSDTVYSNRQWVLRIHELLLAQAVVLQKRSE